MKRAPRELAWMILTAMGGVLISAAVTFVHSQDADLHFHSHSHEPVESADSYEQSAVEANHEGE